MEQALLYNNNHNNTTCKYDSLRNTHIYYFMKKGNLVDNQFVKERENVQIVSIVKVWIPPKRQ